MNDTSASTSAPGWTLLPDGTGVITTIHLVLIVVIALAAIAVIVVGARRKRLRRQAEQQVERNAAEAGVEPAPDPQDTLPTPPPTTTPAPAPSQLQSQTQTEPYREPVARPTSTPAPSVPQAPPASVAAELPGPDVVKRETPVDSLDETTLIAPAGFAAPASPDALATPDAPLTTLKGLGPKVATRLQELGIDTVGQLAALSVDQADALDARLGTFRGRMMRDRWIEQARFLAARDRAGFEAAFGRL